MGANLFAPVNRRACRSPVALFWSCRRIGNGGKLESHLQKYAAEKVLDQAASAKAEVFDSFKIPLLGERLGDVWNPWNVQRRRDPSIRRQDVFRLTHAIERQALLKPTVRGGKVR